MRKLNIPRLGIAFGVAWGLFTFLGGMAAAWFGWGVPLVEMLASFYIGFAPTFIGSLIGAVWGFVSGMAWGSLIAWVYNKGA